ncbi:hypothetical protein JKP88DRAFT_233785 [Tribonema minus]|uniref:Uncharacterized protein n=1 Tax=Tribonema minus TaxID=303371 RepID=A0A835Z9E3_9STRA|nr:hypothetical protein JKP88DRAFT_233785 [Tribonema minus]
MQHAVRVTIVRSSLLAQSALASNGREIPHYTMCGARQLTCKQADIELCINSAPGALLQLLSCRRHLPAVVAALHGHGLLPAAAR